MQRLPALAGKLPARFVERELLPIGIFVLLALIPALARLLSEGYLLSLCGRMMIFAIAAVALDLLVGYGGLISFGQAAFIGLGAYAVAILSVHGPPCAGTMPFTKNVPTTPAVMRQQTDNRRFMTPPRKPPGTATLVQVRTRLGRVRTAEEAYNYELLTDLRGA